MYSLYHKFPGATFRQKATLGLATGFGISLVAPIAPGTIGTLPGIILALWVSQQVLPLQFLTCLGLTLLAIPICDVAEKFFAQKDDGRICADEWMLFPLCALGLPLTQHLWLIPVCFITARLFDIIKPAPARQIQALPGGLGIVLDDFFSSLYALACNHIIYYLVMRYA